MNKKLWYINAALAVLLVITWIGAIAGLPEYPSEAVFEKNAHRPGMGVSGSQETESQTITAARGFSNWLDPPPAYGSVKVVIEPAEAIAAGGGWRVGGSEWLESGVLAEKVTPGEKGISFKQVKGWVAPEVKVVVEKDKTTEITATYTVPPRGFVKVTIIPEQVSEFSPQWMIDEGQWLNSGDTSQVVSVGSYGLVFKEIEGWDMPEVFVDIEDQKTLEVTAEYKLIRYGNINAIAAKDSVLPEGAGWRYQEGDWLKFGVEPQKTRFGSYTISFRDVPDWNKPADVSLSIEEEKTYDVEAVYTPIPYAQVTVKIKPENNPLLSGAQWWLDDGQKYNFGQTAEKVTMGQHVINYSVVNGWQPIAGLNIEITEEKGYDFGGEYVRIRPPAPTFVFRAVIETGGGKGVAFTSTKQGYKVGEEIEGFRIVRMSKSKVILTKEGFEYEVVVAENKQLTGPAGAIVPPQSQPRPTPGGSPGMPNPGTPGMQVPSRPDMGRPSPGMGGMPPQPEGFRSSPPPTGAGGM